jgi:BMFP domain-containing protein YqiC
MQDYVSRQKEQHAMTQSSNRLLDEFAKLMTDAAGVADGFRREAETAFKSLGERFMADMDIVKRDDFDAFAEMAANARAENDVLKKRLEALEARVSKLEGGAKGANVSPREKK